MSEVYVDVSAASLEAGSGAAGVEMGLDVTSVADPEAIRALRYLAESGMRIVIVRPSGGPEPARELVAAAAAVVAAVPARPQAPAWYLTTDIERCQGSSAHLRTVLIGGTPPSGSIRRCDAVARDVQAAAMEILAAIAMPGPGVAT